MRRLALSCVLLMGLTANAQFLKTSGTKIVNEKGENIVLRGMGLGGWMLQEGYMLRLNGTNPQYSICKRIEQLVGPQQTQEFYDAWLKNFITKADIDSMRKWGFNSVRLPMHYNLYTLSIENEPDSSKNTWLEKGFQLTDSLLKWCKANQMYLILDLHAAPGGQGNDLNISDRDSTKPSLWQSAANQAKTIALWKKLAERYKNEPWIGAYDIINEPNWGFEDPADKNGLKESGNKPLRELMVKITEAIRSVDRKHIVIIEGNGWGNNYKGVFPLWDNNTVISFHKYWNYNDAKSIQHMLDARTQQNAPVWVGETGENSNTWFSDAVQLLEQNNIGWCWWPLKKLGNNNPLEIKSNANYNKLVDHWNGRGQAIAPSSADAYKGLMELASSTHNRYNKVCRDVIDALIRQPFDAKTVPFAVSGNGVINAVDYDLGRNGIAYYDKDTGNYRVSTGRNSAGNRGRTYRNDGVDIYADSSGTSAFYIGNIEDGEWLQYTVTLNENGPYDLKIVSAAKNGGDITVQIDDKPVIENAALNTNTGWQSQSLGKLQLNKGKHVIRIKANKGGFYLKQLALEKPQPLPRSTAQAENFDASAVDAYFNAVKESKQDVHSVMILRHGKVIAERWLGDNAPDKPHILNSVSKTFTATAIGFLVAEKKMKLTDKVISFFPDHLPDTVSAYLKELNIKHLLTMSVGHDVNLLNADRRKETNDWIKLFLSNPIYEKPGTQFSYNSLATYMLSAIVQKVSKQKLIDYLTPRLFQPLGITGAYWEECPQGINVGGWGLFVKTEDMAKLGQFILQQGKWNGKQLLPASWFKEATSSQIESLPAGVKKEEVKAKKEDSDWLQGYGYQMWMTRHDAYRADGARGQFIIILPRLDAVIVATADVGDMQSEINLMWKYLLPAFR